MKRGLTSIVALAGMVAIAGCGSQSDSATGALQDSSQAGSDAITVILGGVQGVLGGPAAFPLPECDTGGESVNPLLLANTTSEAQTVNLTVGTNNNEDTEIAFGGFQGEGTAACGSQDGTSPSSVNLPANSTSVLYIFTGGGEYQADKDQSGNGKQFEVGLDQSPAFQFNVNLNSVTEAYESITINGTVESPVSTSPLPNETMTNSVLTFPALNLTQCTNASPGNVTVSATVLGSGSQGTGNGFSTVTYGQNEAICMAVQEASETIQPDQTEDVQGPGAGQEASPTALNSEEASEAALDFLDHGGL